MKKIISLLLSIVIIFSSGLFNISFSAGGISYFAVNPYGNERNTIDTVKWVKLDKSWYLFLPSDCDLSNLTVYYDAPSDITVNSEKILNGKITDAFSHTGKYTLSCGIYKYKLNVMKSENIPAVYINTASGSLKAIQSDKNYKEKGSVRIYDKGILSLDSDLKQIKGRGNATWHNDKKPYNIKFDSKTSVLGMDKAKKWTLLASYDDTSLLKNPLSWFQADLLGLEYSSDYRHIDLYANGEYLGNYIICESVEIGKNRVDITDLTKLTEGKNDDDLENYSLSNTGDGNVKGSKKWADIPNNPDNITGGYLLEYDYINRYNEEVSGFVTDNGQCITIKEPEYASKVQVEYISALFNDATNAIYSPDGYNSKGKHYSEYFDMKSLVSMYILEEFAEELDAGLSSFYVYKNSDDDKLYFSPAWDFDKAYGSDDDRFNWSTNDPSIWWANSMFYCNKVVENKTEMISVMNAAFRHDDFRTAVNKQWNYVKDKLAGKDSYDYIDNLGSKLESSALMDGIRWDHFTTVDKYKAEVNYIKNFLAVRGNYLNIGFSDNVAMLYYDSNGSSGNILNPYIRVIGESEKVLGPKTGKATISSPKKFLFKCWNTKPDGSGKSYYPGDTIKLTEKNTVLYAQWVNPTSCQHICHSDNFFLKFIWKIELSICKIFGIGHTCSCGVVHY